MKPTFNKKLLRVATLVGLTGAISLSSIGTIFAKDPPADAKNRQGVFGTVTAKGEHTFELKLRSGETISLNVADATKFRIPGDADPAFADIKVGSNVAVLAERSDSGTLALHVLMIPSEVRKEHRVLRVLEINGNIIIAQDADGHQVVITLDHEVSADIKGMLVTFIGERSEASDLFKANAEMKIEQVIKRLEKMSDKLDAEAKTEADDKVREEKQKDAGDIKARLKANMESHIAFFEKLIARAPDSAKPALKEALEKTIAGYRVELDAIEKLGDQLNETKKISSATGTVAEVSASGEIKIKVKDGTFVTVKTNADTKIQVNGKEGTLADVKAGSSIGVRYTTVDSIATQIVIRNEADAKGKIQSVDSAAHKVFILSSNGTTLTLTITNTTAIELNGKAATEGDLKANFTVKVIYNSITMEATRIQASSMTSFEGKVKSVNTADNTVTITSRAGTEVTVKVVDSTKVVIRGVLRGILGLAPGIDIVANYDISTNIASEIKANAEEPRSADK